MTFGRTSAIRSVFGVRQPVVPAPRSGEGLGCIEAQIGANARSRYVAEQIPDAGYNLADRCSRGTCQQCPANRIAHLARRSSEMDGGHLYTLRRLDVLCQLWPKMNAEPRQAGRHRRGAEGGTSTRSPEAAVSFRAAVHSGERPVKCPSSRSYGTPATAAAEFLSGWPARALGADHAANALRFPERPERGLAFYRAGTSGTVIGRTHKVLVGPGDFLALIAHDRQAPYLTGSECSIAPTRSEWPRRTPPQARGGPYSRGMSPTAERREFFTESVTRITVSPHDSELQGSGDRTLL